MLTRVGVEVVQNFLFLTLLKWRCLSCWVLPKWTWGLYWVILMHVLLEAQLISGLYFLLQFITFVLSFKLSFCYTWKRGGKFKKELSLCYIIRYQFVPQVIFLNSLFGYLSLLIIIKWCTGSQADLYHVMIYMFLSPFDDLGENELFWGQRPLQVWSLTLVSIVADHVNLMFFLDVCNAQCCRLSCWCWL